MVPSLANFPPRSLQQGSGFILAGLSWILWGFEAADSPAIQANISHNSALVTKHTG